MVNNEWWIYILWLSTLKTFGWRSHSSSESRCSISKNNNNRYNIKCILQLASVNKGFNATSMLCRVKQECLDNSWQGKWKILAFSNDSNTGDSCKPHNIISKIARHMDSIVSSKLHEDRINYIGEQCKLIKCSDDQIVIPFQYWIATTSACNMRELV